MKLDSRIKALSDVLTCFDTEKAEQFIGQKGFFANSIDYFREGAPFCAYGTLKRIFDHEDQTDPFLNGEVDELYSFFIPERSLKSAKKKYRPFTSAKEFFLKTNFEIGDVIQVRYKENNVECHLMLVGGSDYGIMLGSDNLSFNNLLNQLDLWDGEDKFIPFGVEE